MSTDSKNSKRKLQSKLTGGSIFIKKPKADEYIVCPVCEIEINATLIHLHVDSCLLKSTIDKNDQHGELTTLASPTLNNDLCASTINSSMDQTDSEEAALPPGIQLEEMTKVPGLWLIHNFITEEEEAEVVRSLDEDSTPWHFSSFNGNCNSKSFGVKTQFGAPGEERCVRRNNPAIGEHDIPPYLDKFPVRLQQVIQQEILSCRSNSDARTLGLLSHRKRVPPPEVVKFVPNECNANSYEAKSKHYLRAHFDDRILSGPILMNLSLEGDARMTYHLASSSSSASASDRAVNNEQEFAVFLPRRTLQLVTGPARWKFRHSIKTEDVLSARRVSVTWRRSESKNAGIRHQSQAAHDARVVSGKYL